MCREELGAGPQIIQSPLLKIELLPIEQDVSKYQALIFTSENGVRAYVKSRGHAGLPAFCVGERTAKAATEAGLKALSANGTADELVALVQGAALDGPLLHIRGEHTRGNIAERIDAQVDEAVAYQQVPVNLTGEAQSLLDGDKAVILPLFSPRTAQLFFKLVTNSNAQLRVVAISEAVKEAIVGSNPPENMNILVADTPDAVAMLRAIKRCIVT